MSTVVRLIQEADREDWVRLRHALWPGSLADHERETRAYFEERHATPVVLVAEEDGRLLGFLELDFRKYAPGCTSSPVAFVEGWYVDDRCQRQGIGRALMRAAEEHARRGGYTELASDSEVDNSDGIAAHRALGFVEIERVVCWRKALA